jgi:hypothetical protein
LIPRGRLWGSGGEGFRHVLLAPGTETCSLAKEPRVEYRAMTLAQVEKVAFALPPLTRAKLVDDLLLSLSGPGSREVEKVWADEAEARIEAFDASGEKAIPASEVLRPLKRKPRRCK